ncbi:class I SAM-dependent methyltransferase [Methylosinus sp. H3A]|uniref:class I SAM-dependent methyltransferase n=1 Tax=Methylosinus sp. H3A TaxID=2785786 RepID=UPI0018C348C8|nr:class I SAM-dependent methyltransferase [Methylosinus sp. H3A]MBG0810181.1 class I SAM-dependent methyltransferase [Methylosinus sp. H3A]
MSIQDNAKQLPFGRRMLRALRSLVGLKNEPLPVEHVKLNRSQYKTIWNSVSVSEDNAKMAVSGYIDEDLYRQMGEGTRDMLQNYVGIGPNDVVLEIGAGVGRVGAALAPICKEWIGADVAENMLGHIRQRLAAFDNVRTVATSGFDLSAVPDASVDVVYSTVVFMHLEEWDRYSYIKEGFRILRPGGRMLVDNVDITSDLGWKFFEEHCAVPPFERPAQISKTSTPQELETYFQRAGYEAIEQVRAGLWIVTYGRKPAAPAQEAAAALEEAQAVG